jgi:hypothetical protein
VARHDLQLDWDEFESLTPSMFQALCRRRNIRLKHERFANALTASAVYNVNRASSDSPIMTAFDFVRDEKSSRARAERLAIKAQIAQSVGTMPTDTPREKFMEIRQRVIASLTAKGRADAEELWKEVWPTLVPIEVTA